MRNGQIPHDIALMSSNFDNNRRAKVLLFIFPTKIFFLVTPSNHPKTMSNYQYLTKINSRGRALRSILALYTANFPFSPPSDLSILQGF